MSLQNVLRMTYLWQHRYTSVSFFWGVMADSHKADILQQNFIITTWSFGYWALYILQMLIFNRKRIMFL